MIDGGPPAMPVSDEEEARALLEADAEMFLRSGGVLTRAEWGAMDPIHRESFAVAGHRRTLELAAHIAASVVERIGAAAKEATEEDALLEAMGGEENAP